MNKINRIIIISALLAVATTCLVPPFQYDGSGRGHYTAASHGLVFTQHREHRLDLGRLTVELLAVSALAGAALLLTSLKMRPSESGKAKLDTVEQSPERPEERQGAVVERQTAKIAPEPVVEPPKAAPVTESQPPKPSRTLELPKPGYSLKF
jgi:hypothetical protein